MKRKQSDSLQSEETSFDKGHKRKRLALEQPRQDISKECKDKKVGRKWDTKERGKGREADCTEPLLKEWDF